MGPDRAQQAWKNPAVSCVVTLTVSPASSVVVKQSLSPIAESAPLRVFPHAIGVHPPAAALRGATVIARNPAAIAAATRPTPKPPLRYTIDGLLALWRRLSGKLAGVLQERSESRTRWPASHAARH